MGRILRLGKSVKEGAVQTASLIMLLLILLFYYFVYFDFYSLKGNCFSQNALVDDNFFFFR